MFTWFTKIDLYSIFEKHSLQLIIHSRTQGVILTPMQHLHTRSVSCRNSDMQKAHENEDNRRSRKRVRLSTSRELKSNKDKHSCILSSLHRLLGSQESTISSLDQVVM